MKKIAIATDSNSGITQAEAKEKILLFLAFPPVMAGAEALLPITPQKPMQPENWEIVFRQPQELRSIHLKQLSPFIYFPKKDLNKHKSDKPKGAPPYRNL